MYKQWVLILFCFVIFIFCVTTIHAVDVNVSDSNNTLYNDSSIQKENKTQIEDSNLNETRNQTELTSQTSNIYHGGSYSLILKDRNTFNPIANKNVSFVIGYFGF